MTYAKYGTEFFDDCADQGLTVDATLTHAQAIGWIYRVERDDMTVMKHLLRRFVTSDAWETAAKDLVACGFWQDRGDAYVVVHHADVVRQSLVAQRKKRERDKKAQATHRRRQANANVSDELNTDVSAYAVSQTDNQATTGATTNSKPDDEVVWPPARRPPDSAGGATWG